MKDVGASATGPWSDSITVAVGANVYYRITVANNGNVALTGITVSDPNVSTAGCTWTDPLGVGATTSCVVGPVTAVAGTRTNTATADSNETGPDTDGASYFGSAPVLNIIKDVGASATGPWSDSITVAVGANVYYRITVANNGNVALTGITVSDPNVSTAGCTWTDPLGVGATTSCVVGPVTAVAGTRTNTATADSNETGPDTDGASYFGSAPVLNIIKDVGASATGPWSDSITVAVGANVYYRITVANNGNVALTGITVSDPNVSTAGCTWTDPLGVGATTSCVVGPVTAVAGTRTNTATADSNETGPDTDGASYFGSAPVLNIIKDVGASATGPWSDSITVAVGANVYYRITVANNGNVALTGITVSDPNVSTAGCTWTDPLGVGATTSCVVGPVTAVAGTRTNTATADSNETGPDTDGASYFGSAPVLNIIKDVGASATGPWSDSITVAVGANVYYRITVANNGNVALTGITVSDPNVSTAGCTWTDPLGVGATTSCVVGPVTAVAGTRTNTATADSNETGPDTDGASYFGSAPVLNIIKDVGASATGPWSDSITVAVGANVYYRITVANNGNVALTGITVSDPNVSTAGCTWTDPLGVGATTSCVVGPVTAVAGTRTNTATADSNETGPDTDGASYFGSAPVLNIIKDVGASATGPWSDSITVAVGANVYYRITVANNGNVALTGITVSDPNVSTAGCTWTDPLGVGATTSCVVGPVTAVAGTRTNTATADSNETGPDTDGASYFGSAPVLNIIKDVGASATGPWSDSITVAVGANVYYRITVANNGNVALTGITVSDPNVSTAGCTWTDPLGVGATTSCVVGPVTAVAGTRTNTATADSNETGPDTDSASYFGTNPSLNVVKEVSVDGGLTWLDANLPTGPNLASGTDPRFRFTVRNTGDVTLTGISLTDSDFATTSCTIPGSLTANDGTNGSGTDEFTCTINGTWTIGQHSNTATATGTYNSTTYTDTDLAHYYGVAPGIVVVKEVSVDGGLMWLDADTAPGPNLLFGTNPQFLFTVRNTGNVTLTGISLTDSDFATTGCTIPGSLTADDGTNGSGTDEFTCTITGTWAAGQHTNTATATGIFNSTTYSDMDDANYVGIDPGYRICNSSSSADPSGTIKDSGGSVSNYSNNENCTFLISSGSSWTSITLTFSSFNTEAGYDYLRIYDGTNALSPSLGTFSGTSLPGAVTATSGNMFLVFSSDFSDTAPGFVADWITTNNPTDYSMCSGSTSSSNDSGSISDSGGVNSNYGNNESCSFLIQPGGGGSKITLSFAQFTTENISDHLTIYDGTDDNSGVFLGDFWGPTLPANLTAYSGSMFLQWSSDTSNTFPGYIASWTSEVYAPSIVLTKTASVSSVDTAGDVITYTFSVQNTGNVSLSNLNVSDTLLSGLICTAITNLLPGASQTFSCSGNSYIVSQADLDTNGAGLGYIENTATVIGTLPDSSTVSDTDIKTVAITQTPEISIEKYVSPDNGLTWLAADSAPGAYLPSTVNPRFRFIVTNSGNVTLTSIVLSDPEISGFFKSNLTTPCSPTTTLTPGYDFICYAELPWVPGPDWNTATADGLFNATPVSDSDDAYFFGSVPSIALTKSASPSSVSSAGDVITYTFTAQNTGNSPLSNVTVSDSLLVSLSCTPIGNLPAGSSLPFVCTSNTYLVSQADMDSNGGGDGDVDNTATVNGTSPESTLVSNTDSESVTITTNPEITLTKSADRINVTAAGDLITYSFSVQNTGNVTITGITLTDSLLTPTGLSCDTVTSLSPGDVHSFTCSNNIYTVTAADIASGSIYIVNTATVSGTPPFGLPISDSDSVAVYLPPPLVSTIQPGLPDATYVSPPNGATLVYNLGIPLYAMSTPDGNPDLVYFERNADLDTIQMDSVIVEIGDFFLNVWYMIFNWGNGIADTNSNLNIDNPAVGGSESDNQIITKTSVPLYGTPSLNTGITIDIDGYAPAGTPYQWLRIAVPTGGAGDGADIDSILVLPTKTPTLVPTSTNTPVPPTATPEPPTAEPPTDTPVPTPTT